jgi:hypothetical protein
LTQMVLYHVIYLWNSQIMLSFWGNGCFFSVNPNYHISFKEIIDCCSSNESWFIHVIRICRSYELMEDNLKVYIYREGEKPILHQPRLNGIYASEGWFITRDPRKAHLFYLPFSSLMLEETLYIPNSHSFDKLIQFLRNYLDMIAAKYSFWNRTGGADHFLVACHDWVCFTSFLSNYVL